MLAMLEHMSLTCCVLPQGKALNVHVKWSTKCIVYLTYAVNARISARGAYLIF